MVMGRIYLNIYAGKFKEEEEVVLLEMVSVVVTVGKS
jgi:hypothetical protein